MSERGVFAVDRGIFDHPKLQDAKHPFSKLEAWLWLLSSAAWKPHKRQVSGRWFNLQRGQLVASTRYMAAAWRWSEAKVRRFLEALKTDAEGDAEIDAATDAGVTVITIRKYNQYQFGGGAGVAAGDALSDAESGAEVTQERRKEEEREEQEDNKHTRAKRSQRVKPLRFNEFWAIYPRREGDNPKQPALKEYEKAVNSGVDEADIIAGVTNFATEAARRREVGTRFVPHARKWLHNACWKDHLPSAGNHPPQVIIPPPIDWDAKMSQYTRMPAHSRTWYGPGSEPGQRGCEVPPEILKKYDITPWSERAA